MKESPDVVIIATGAQSLRLSISGRSGVTVQEALSGELDAARRVLILDREGFMRPWVVADRLSALGAEITFVTPFLRLSPHVEGWVLDELLRTVGSYTVEGLDRSYRNPAHPTPRIPIRFMPGFDVGSWREEGVIVRDVQRGAEDVLPGIDAVVAAVGSSPINDLADELRNLGPEVFVIGDAVSPATVENATYQGARLGRIL